MSAIQESKYTSFFNDSTPFGWSTIPQLPTQITLSGELRVMNKHGKYKYRHFILSRNILIKCSKTNKYITLDNLQIINNAGLQLHWNQFRLTLIGDVDPWFQAIKCYCIQNHFTTRYSVVQLLGSGTFAKVYKVKCKSTNELYAAKAFDKSLLKIDNQDREAVLKELQILRQMNHPGVINILECFESEQFILIIQELYHGGELYEQLKNADIVEESVACRLIYNLLDAVSYIHSNGIIHRDIKPENLIIRNELEDVVIADFGLADYYSKSCNYMFKRCGTPGYAAPELLQDKPYDYKVDVYSVGVLLYILLVGKSPFQGKCYDDVIRLNYKGMVDYSNINRSREAISLLQGMLHINPLQRLTAAQAKQHPWFRKHIIKLKITLSGLTTPRKQHRSVMLNVKQINVTEHIRKPLESLISPRYMVVKSLINKQQQVKLTPINLPKLGNFSKRNQLQ